MIIGGGPHKELIAYLNIGQSFSYEEDDPIEKIYTYCGYYLDELNGRVDRAFRLSDMEVINPSQNDYVYIRTINCELIS